MLNKSADHNKTSKFDRIAMKGMRFIERPEKLFLLILIFGLLTIVGSVWFWRVNVSRVFTINQIIKDQEDNSAQQAVDDFNELLADQQKDTDQDGLTDYFEINIYKTSAYLPDSDSDGIDDKTEIDQGTNPNCPEGQECGIIIPNDSEANLLDAVVSTQPSDTSYDAELAQGMRQLLIENGIEPEMLDTVTDAELLLLYDQIIKENEPVQPTTDISPTEDIDATALREILLNSGVDKGILDQLTDEQLMETYLETLQSESSSQ